MHAEPSCRLAQAGRVHASHRSPTAAAAAAPTGTKQAGNTTRFEVLVGQTLSPSRSCVLLTAPGQEHAVHGFTAAHVFGHPLAHQAGRIAPGPPASRPPFCDSALTRLPWGSRHSFFTAHSTAGRRAQLLSALAVPVWFRKAPTLSLVQAGSACTSRTQSFITPDGDGCQQQARPQPSHPPFIYTSRP